MQTNPGRSWPAPAGLIKAIDLCTVVNLEEVQRVVHEVVDLYNRLDAELRVREGCGVIAVS